MVVLGVQISRRGCNGEQNQKYDIAWDSRTGAFTLVSSVSQKCWDNGGGYLFDVLRQFNCTTGTQERQKFYLEYQGYVPGCEGPAKQNVRT